MRIGMLQRIAPVMIVLLLATHGYSQLFPTFVNGQFTLGNESGGSPYDLADTFFLESNPTASKTLYLDYDGYHSVNNLWNHDIDFDPFDLNGDPSSFVNFELLQIQRQFQNVAEDFLPFDVNVTTLDPGVDALRKTSAADNEYGVRSLNTQNKNGFGNGIGGVAHLNVFDLNIDNPIFTFNTGENNGAMTNSHEIGHALGLLHDGLNASTYHPGVGSGSSPVSWGPLMGAPFGTNLTQWSNGDYPGATSSQDDLSIITNSKNDINFRTDEIGDSIATAKALDFQMGQTFDWGIIEQNTDVDVFELTLGRGALDLSILPFQGRANLDILTRLYDSSGIMLSESNPVNDLDASLQWDVVDPGEYYVSIEGTGNPGIYSDYGSLGFFTIQGSFDSVATVPEPSHFGVVLIVGLAGFFYRRQQ